ncbi:MAG: hypothetical protein WCU88_12330 [Elusimicrobiota bacterium]|jgi:nitrate/nitrite-specific signal transduction histidine kinase
MDPYEGTSREELISALQASQARAADLEGRLSRVQDELAWLEDSLKKRTRELNERVKELDCLFSVSHLLERPHADLEEMIREVVALLPKALQHADCACSRVRLGEKEFRSENYRSTRWMLESPIRLHGHPVGCVEIGYLREKPAAQEGPFLREERCLIDEVARRVAEMEAVSQAARCVARLRACFAGLPEKPSAS